jgi:signal transduction histidine kinase
MLSVKNSKSIIRFVKLIPVKIGVGLLLVNFFSCSPAGSKKTSSDYDKVLDETGRIYDSGKTAIALHYLDSVTGKYKNLEVLQKFYYFDFNYNFFYHIKNNKNNAMLYADSMLNLFNTNAIRLKYTPQYGQAHFFKGDILFDENKYDDAYQYYYQGKIIASNSLDDCTLSEYSYRMGMIMYKQGHFRIAASYFKISSTETNTCEWTFRSFYRRQELLNNTGLCYSKINEPDSGMIFYKKALKYIDSTGVEFKIRKDLLDVARGVVYGNEAGIYILKGNYKLAENLLKKSININLRKGNDNNDAQLSELKLAHLYDQQNKTDSLLNLLQVVHAQFDTIKSKDAEADWNLLMANYYIKKGSPKDAFNYLLQHDALKDSITNRDKKLKEADVTEQMERLTKNYEFENLKKNNELQRIYVKTALVFGLMLILIISLIFMNWQKSKKNIKTLGGLNNQISDQNYHLENALNELNISSQEKDRILRTVAHDLRNPLGGVASLTGLMAEENEYTTEQKELINLIKETSNNSLELINEILEATDNESVKTQKDKELVEINALVNHSVELLRFKAAEKNQHIIVETIRTPVELFISREKIWRVISNLISNAIKFSPENAYIGVKLIDEEKEVKILVTDNGIGIPDEIKDNIFKMFTDSKRPGTAGEKSFGLGLSICQQIIENHNGKIWFESNPNKGTTFYITLNKPV